MEKKPLENKIAKKTIKQIDLESLIPKATNIVAFDIKGFLFKELILKEKDFRQQLSSFDFNYLENKYVYVFCSTKAIIPLWAYMLLVTYINQKAKTVIFAENIESATEKFVEYSINNIDLSIYKNKRVIVKGCSNKKLSTNVYIVLVNKLQEEVKSIMFGEACSMLPIYKK